MVKEYELVIIGGGPGGLTSGIYARRSRLNTIMLESNPMPGGQMALTDIVENYPGFPEPLTGFELAQKMKAHAERFDLEIATETVKSIEEANGKYLVKGEKDDYLTTSIIISTGSQPRPIGIPGEMELRGGGVTYCATCDGPFTRDLVVAVIGGGDSAVGEAIYLTKFASKVYIIHRRDEFRAEKYHSEKAIANDKIEILWDTVPLEVIGDDSNQVTGLKIQNVKTEETSLLDVQFAFIYVGVNPNTGFVDGFLDLDDGKYIVTDEELLSSKPGIFVAGDCRAKTLKQVATAVGEGALAAFNANEYIEHQKK